MFAKVKEAAASVVVYGGADKQERNGVTYLPWSAIQDYAWDEQRFDPVQRVDSW